jgi:hypothetical protein
LASAMLSLQPTGAGSIWIAPISTISSFNREGAVSGYCAGPSTLAAPRPEQTFS